MRSLAVSALVLACACGNLSNEDLAFLSALPQKGQLRVDVPQGTVAQALCGPGTYGDADSWNHSRATGDALNAGVDSIVALVETVRHATPTARGIDDRTWGPFPDKDHPGVELRIVMQRELDANDLPWRFLYTFEARRPPAAPLPILTGEFYGVTAAGGIGKLVLRFDNLSQLGMTKPTDPVTPMRVFYDFSGDPRTISVDLTQQGVNGLSRFDYFWAGYADGHGRFDYAFPGNNGCTISTSAGFTKAGAGQGSIHFECPTGRGDLLQCWSASSCLTYVDDPYAFTPACAGAKPCLLGTKASCPVF